MERFFLHAVLRGGLDLYLLKRAMGVATPIIPAPWRELRLEDFSLGQPGVKYRTLSQTGTNKTPHKIITGTNTV